MSIEKNPNLYFQEKATEIMVQLLCGSLGGGVSTFFTYPLSIIRLKKMVE